MLITFHLNFYPEKKKPSAWESPKCAWGAFSSPVCFIQVCWNVFIVAIRGSVVARSQTQSTQMNAPHPPLLSLLCLQPLRFLTWPSFPYVCQLKELVILWARENEINPVVYGALTITPCYSKSMSLGARCGGNMLSGGGGPQINLTLYKSNINNLCYILQTESKK